MTNQIVFLVRRPENNKHNLIENVIITSTTREYAKSSASHILGGDPDQYIVDPMTKSGSLTAFLISG